MDVEKVLEYSMDISHVVVNGCSFAYGQGLEKITEQSWAGLLAKKLNLPIVNIAGKGSGNDSIMRRTFQYFYQNLPTKSKPLFVITLSQAIRREEYVIRYKDSPVRDFVTLACYSDEPIERGIYEHYDDGGIVACELRKLVYWSAMINLLKANNIPYIIADFMPEHDEKIIDKVKSIVPDMYNELHNDTNMVGRLDKITFNYPKLPCGHDGIAGNIALSEHLYSHIVKRYDVNPVNIPYVTAKEYLFLACQTQYYAGLDWCNNV